MRSNYHMAILKAVVFAVIILLVGMGVSAAQVTVNLTASRQSTLLPDGNTVPMWGWTCGAVTNTTTTGPQASCVPINAAFQLPNPAPTPSTWAPPLITVPTGSSVTIVLTNNLPVETSLTIVGQFGTGSTTTGVGNPVRESGPRMDGAHAGQQETTWTTNVPATFIPPAQAARARSFVQEATPGGTQTYTWTTVRPGTFLIETGTYPSIQGPMGLYGVLVVSAAPTTAKAGTAFAAGTAYSGKATTGAAYNITYDADVPLLLSEIDPVQNRSVEHVAEIEAGCPVNTGACSGTISAAIETAKWNPTCAASNIKGSTCYPPAVDYTPLYYLVNGASFDKTASITSAAAIASPNTAGATASTGNVLLRFVNAGLRLHMPAVSGLSMSLIAEDANVLPDVALGAAKATPNLQVRVQSHLFLPAGKVFDVLINPPNNAAAGAAPTAYTPNTYVVFDRELSLSENAFRHESGMQAILQVAGAAITPLVAKAVVNDNFIVPAGAPAFMANVLNNDIGIANASATNCGTTYSTAPQTISTSGGTVVLNPNGSFTFTPTGTFTNGATTTFNYFGDCTYGPALVTLNAAAIGARPVAMNDSYTTNVVSLIKVNAPGVLANDSDPTGYPLSAVCGTTASAVCSVSGLKVSLNPDGGFTATPTTGAGTYSFTYYAKNSQGTLSNSATVSITVLPASGLNVVVQDAQTQKPLPGQDYRWLIERDLMFHVDPATQVNTGTGIVPSLATNFHTSYMPVVAAGCTGPQSCERDQTVYNPATGQHVVAACDGSGICQLGQAYLPTSTPANVNLPTIDTTGTACTSPGSPTGCNPNYGSTIYYYLSVLPGDAANPFNTGNVQAPTASCPAGTTPTGQSTSTCGHTMGGAPIIPVCTGTGTARTCTLPTSVTVNVEPNPLPTAAVSVYVFEDDNELNGEIDAEQGVEPGLEGFNIELWDTGGGAGDLIGQMTYDMFNEPLTNALVGAIDPLTRLNACPVSKSPIVGVIVVCPAFEADGKTVSPLVGQAVIKGLMPGKYSIIAHPGAEREARGEEWVQTNTLDGTHFLDSFIRMGEPAFFQEYGPAGYHVFMGFASPAIINAQLKNVCAGLLTFDGVPTADGIDGVPNPLKCNNTIKGQITNLRISRSPDERIYDSAVVANSAPATGAPAGTTCAPGLGQSPNCTANPADAVNRAPLLQSTCFVSLGVLDSPDIGFAKCDANGNFTLPDRHICPDCPGIPDGNYSLTVFDQWLDQLIFEKEVVVSGGKVLDIGTYPVFTWQQAAWTNTYMDLNQNGIQDLGEPGLIQIPARVRLRNGRFANTIFTDINGRANFNETTPLLNWYTIESDTTRFKSTGVHVVYDAGGPPDPTGPYAAIAHTTDTFSPLTGNLRYPGSVYCAAGDAACTSSNYSGFTNTTGGGPGGSTGRIDPGSVEVEGWNGIPAGEIASLDWGKTPYLPGENGGIRGHVTYSSTRPFDDPRMLFQNLWEPLVPNVTMNLYQEVNAPDGTTALKLVDTTQTSSWDAWVQGQRLGANGQPLLDLNGNPVSNINCPGQDPNDPFLKFTLGTANTWKCYDSMHAFNQVQPAPYDGLYEFPSANCRAGNGGATFTTTVNGQSQTIHCITVANPANNAATQKALNLNPNLTWPAVLPAGKYVVEAVTPPGYEITKEEDKNILIGDNFIAPVTQQFAPITNIFIVPDQATINNANPSYTGPVACNLDPTTNACTGAAFSYLTQNPGNPTTDMGRTTFGSFGPGGLIVQNAPCVGLMRIVPDFMSLSPESGEVAPFAGATRPLCDRKEVTLEDQMQGIAEFFIWTKTPAASHFTGFINDDFASEFDPNSPSFGEKFAVPNIPVAVKDYRGVEVSRVYSDEWGIFNGLVFSTWQVNPPNPAGYAPGMMIQCMNDPGPIKDTNPSSPTFGMMIIDPNFNPQYSNFCYENPFMPEDTDYLDTPVVPISAFAEGYNPPDCTYPDATPAILRVDSSAGFGPYLPATGGTLTITALGDQQVPNHAYSGPFATTTPYNQKFVKRHYGFGPAGTVSIDWVNPDGHLVSQRLAATWSDTTITATVPATIPPIHSGTLVITSGNGKRSIDTVTVTVGLPAGNTVLRVNTGQSIQAAIDAANPGDLIMVNGTVTGTSATANCSAGVPSATCAPSLASYTEMLIMWKPVRLQGVGAASVMIDANAHPAGKLDAWRARVECLFGLNNGAYISATNPAPANCTAATGLNASDPLPDENLISWNVCEGGNTINTNNTCQAQNGFIGEILVEHALMGALEGAGVTVFGKGMTNTAAVATGATPILLNGTSDCLTTSPNYSVGNYLCVGKNNALIDGFTISNSSQGGGGIYVHGWGHSLEISNNRIKGNGGTISGGVLVGQLEVPTSTTVSGQATPYLYDTNVKIHNNGVTENASFGDEFNTDTNAAGGGISLLTGSDYYHVRNNWVCGNLSTGDGGGVSHYGMSFNGDISNNWIVFNESFNQTLTTHGGGIAAQGIPQPGNCEGPPLDLGCPATLSDGVGLDLKIDSNMIMGNNAQGGSGGGLSLLNINGTDVTRNPTSPGLWWRVYVTNNVIADNIAGWAGGGVYLHDVANSVFNNNTVVYNDGTASAGVLFDTVGSNQGSIPPPPVAGQPGCTGNTLTNPMCYPQAPVTTSTDQPAGLISDPHGPLLASAFGPACTATVTTNCLTCPPGEPNCNKFSNPLMQNDIFVQNRTFHITVGANPTPGIQNVVTLDPQLSQATTGACPGGARYWDLGVNGDTSTSGGNPGGFRLDPQSSIVGTGGYSGNSSTAPTFVASYCNGSRVPPEIVASICAASNGNVVPGCAAGGSTGGAGVPPGIPDIDPFYPLFTLNPAATVDEGNNWIDLHYGPLSSTNPNVTGGANGNYGGGAPLGNYSSSACSSGNPNSPCTGARPLPQP